MATDEPFPGAEELVRSLGAGLAISKDWKSWYAGNDPVVRSVVTQALNYLGTTLAKYESETIPEMIGQAVTKLYELLEWTKDSPEVRARAAVWDYDEATDSYQDTGEPLDIDAVDHLMATSHLKLFKPKTKKFWRYNAEVPLEGVLMLLTLGEAKANHPGVAVKAFYVGRSLRAEMGYRAWKEHMQGKSRGGHKSGEAKHEENKDRDEQIRSEAVKRLKKGDDRTKIVQDLSERKGIGRDRINQILRGTPGWPTRSRKSKRNHT